MRSRPSHVTLSSSPLPALVAGALLLAASSGCTRGVSNREPAAPASIASPPAATDAPARSPADVRFVQQMLGHHAQAVVMTDLVAAGTRNERLRALAERIAISQGDEMRLMRRWLQRRGEPVPPATAVDPHAGHGAAGTESHATMPGMISAAELAGLARTTGAEFDRLFLQYMIRHHEGAIAMVATLLAAPGAAQDSELFRLAADIDADQRAEIRRMQALQGASPSAR